MSLSNLGFAYIKSLGMEYPKASSEEEKMKIEMEVLLYISRYVMYDSEEFKLFCDIMDWKVTPVQSFPLFRLHLLQRAVCRLELLGKSEFLEVLQKQFSLVLSPAEYSEVFD